MFKGYKITKRLQRYAEYAKNKYKKLSENGEIDLWDIFQGYEIIMQQPECVQMFLYDMICDEFIHFGEYSIIRGVDGGIYIKQLSKISI